MVWTDRPRHGATLAASALDSAPAGTARAQLYDVQARSLALIGTALQLFSDVPEADRWVAGELAARMDLATARTLRNDLAGAEDALGPVFAVHPEQLTEAVVRRLTTLGRMVGAPRYRGAVEANRIGEAIENFTRTSFRAARPEPSSTPPGNPRIMNTATVSPCTA
ncbi:MAG: hypothetical protein ACRDQ4_16115 [Pseudonocardiaceae bacterium]